MTLEPADTVPMTDAELIEAATEAADWLCDCTPGTDQHDRGLKLRNALAKAKNAVNSLNQSRKP